MAGHARRFEPTRFTRKRTPLHTAAGPRWSSTIQSGAVVSTPVVPQTPSSCADAGPSKKHIAATTAESRAKSAVFANRYSSLPGPRRIGYSSGASAGGRKLGSAVEPTNPTGTNTAVTHVLRPVQSMRALRLETALVPQAGSVKRTRVSKPLLVHSCAGRSSAAAEEEDKMGVKSAHASSGAHGADGIHTGRYRRRTTLGPAGYRT